MSRKRIIIGQSEWGIGDKNVERVVGQVKAALDGGTVEALDLLDAADRAVTVYLNGKTATTVAVDLDGDPRPSEISD